MVRRTWVVGLCVLVIGFWVVRPAAMLAQATNISTQVEALTARAQAGIGAAEANDVAAMQAEYDEIHEMWESFEDAIREHNPGAYVELETALDRVKDAVNATPVDAQTVRQAFDYLMDEAHEVAESVATGPDAMNRAISATPDQVLADLDAAYKAVNAGDTTQAMTYLQAAIAAWPSIEGAIAAKSQQAYAAIETDLGRALTALKLEPADLDAAEVALSHLRTNLSPFTGVQTYTAFDAAAILLREGLEALLVVVALLTFLHRSGNEDKRIWIWTGAGAGILVSIGTAFALQSVFNRIAAGQNREMIEGVTGLGAAALLFYVSYWLHSKASLRAWQQYINVRTTRVLARGSMFGLAALSFLAVFREGAETAIFYLGMAPTIATGELLIGLGVGTGLLVIGAILMLVVGVRLPLRLFFHVAGLLVYYLGFKFVGAGIHALQVAGMLPITAAAFMNEIAFFGIYPTWETLAAQLVLLLGALAVFLYLRKRDRRASVALVEAST